MPLEILPVDELVVLRNYASDKAISVEMGGRGLTPGHTIDCLNTAEILGSPLLRMVIDSKGFEPDVQTAISVIKELLPEFEKRNIRLAIENHDRLKAADFRKIIESVSSSFAGICLDSVNSMGAGEGFETVADILIPYTFNLHIKDFTIFRHPHKMGFTIEGRPAGQGMLDIAGLIEKTENTGLCQSAILELWTPPEKTPQLTVLKEEVWASESIEYLKKLFS
jgi:sugar phosphate isomerase/epimerase